jgi:DNA-binding CsgD family transcriptional regulator/catechol 2,3-dioxygenase-like lactoylglutathione lyase family enzyme
MRVTVGKRRGRPPHDDVLTPAEWRTVHAAQHGLTNREIAARRGISLDAVKYHMGNALGKLGLESRRALRGWFAAPADSALSRASSRRETTMDREIALGQIGRIGQISRSVRNIRESEAFYGRVLGLRHLYTFGQLAFFDCGGTRLYLDEKEDVQPESILYLLVEDIQAAHAELSSRGVEFTNAPHMIFRHADGTEEWMAFFKDPEGRLLAIMAQVKT